MHGTFTVIWGDRDIVYEGEVRDNHLEGPGVMTFKSGASNDIVGLKFQVTDVKKPLLAVRKLVEKGNVVMFGPEPSQNYIHNIEAGKKIMMEKKGGAFVIKAYFMKGIESDFLKQVR